MLSKLKSLFRRLIRNRYLSLRAILAIDTMVAGLSSLCACLVISRALRMYMSFWEVALLFFLSALFSMLASIALRTYRHIIRHSTFKDLWRIAANVILKVAGMAVLWAYLVKGEWLLGFSQAGLFLLIDSMFTFVGMVGVRVFMIAGFEAFARRSVSDRKRILIYGIDEKSVSLKMQLWDSSKYAIVGFYIYDNTYESHRISGLPIYCFDDKVSFQKLMDKKGLYGVLFAKQSDVQMEQDRLIIFLEDDKRKALIAPSIADASAHNQLNGAIRDIKIEDLLGRDEIQINLTNIAADFSGKTIFVTGAAGSIGSELCRQITHFNVKQMIFFDSAETPLHNLQLEFENTYPSFNFIPVIGDVRIRARLKMVFEKYRPDIVLHAAAYKHVPLMENNPCEAVLVNVIGSRNVADMAVHYGVERMIMISTDKAVNPTNVMGASKRMAEIYVQSLGCAIEDGKKGGRTSFITTRFGNVLGSNGSVIPRFKEQIEKGGPVTVTHPDIIRFFMTIPEACRLVLEAASLGLGNEIFVFEMGKAVKIADLARRMITLAGFEPDKDIQIKYTGLRPGEKLYEELLADEENTVPTIHQKINIAKVRRYEHATIDEVYTVLEKLARDVKVEDTVKLMKQVVPEFKSNNSCFSALDDEDPATAKTNVEFTI